ncbi:MAG: DUF1572 domain-containing protein [Gemmatimonadetes bacterium]|nr:DUF1572 domain-containing protein [Gemmatimonadota bacterium]
MTGIVESIRAEFTRYKALAEGALAQLEEHELSTAVGPSDNSIAALVWHLSGNLTSRFTDFLTTDGEKPWRTREEEFDRRTVQRIEQLEKWEAGWRALFAALDALGDDDLERTVTIRGTPFKVHEALHRSLAHTSYHIGQIVYIAKQRRADGWRWLSIPPGGSDAYNRDPAYERPDAHASRLRPEPEN